jgi:hypothetical protein
VFSKRSLSKEGQAGDRLCEHCSSPQGGGHIIREIKAMKEAFQAVEFIHEGRASNDEFDGLMKRSIYESLGRHVWLSFPIWNL